MTTHRSAATVATLRLPFISTVVVAAAIAFAAPTAALAGTPCVEAVFFDLGDTLVENDGSGIFVVRPGAAETVAALQARGVRLGIITNVPATWDIDDLRAILAEPEFLEEFEVVILSSEAPASKPNPAIYVFAHEALAEPRPAITSTAFVGETLIEIGNHETEPTLGARSVGMVGIHLSNLPPSPLADYTIPTDDLGQVASIVDETCSPAGLEGADLDSGVRLLLGQPNPSAGALRLSFSLPTGEPVVLAVFDATGREVIRLAEDRLPAGRHELVWDGCDSAGRRVPSGTYYARLFAGRTAATTRIVTLR